MFAKEGLNEPILKPKMLYLKLLYLDSILKIVIYGLYRWLKVKNRLSVKNMFIGGLSVKNRLPVKISPSVFVSG